MDLSSIFANHRKRNIFFAVFSFLYAFVIYSLTVAPTTSFWDPAEYIAIAHTHYRLPILRGHPFLQLSGGWFLCLCLRSM